MILAYGTYRHALDEAGIVIQRETIFSAARVDIGTRERWIIDGRLQADDQASLTLAIRALTAAYDQQGQDLTLYLSDGKTPTAHRLRSADTLGGVRVTRKPTFPDGHGAEYATFRSYRIELEAEFARDDVTTNIVEWLETLNFSGGGERWAYLPTLNGLPQRQTLQQCTPFRFTQTGRAVGYFAYPTPAAPLWPAAWHQDQGGVTRKLPRRVGVGRNAADVEYEITWQYHFEAALPLSGDPTPRP